MNKKVRQSNFEILRILSMLMIIGHHLAFHGIQHGLVDRNAYEAYNAGSLVNKIVVAFLNTGGQIGVALFFMITGYFHIRKKQPSILKVVLESVFYGMFSIATFIIVKLLLDGFSTLGTADGLMYLLKIMFNPATGGAWWFVSVYILLLLIVPLLNTLLLKLNKKGFLLLIIVTWVLWYSIAAATGAYFYNLQRGVFFYMIGGYCRLHCAPIQVNWKRAVGVLVTVISWIVGAVIFYKCSAYSEETLKYKIINQILNTTYVAFVVPVCGICIFRLFESIDIGAKKVINIFSGTTLGIYMIHDSLIVRSFVWHDLLKVDTLFYSKDLFPIFAILIIVMIFFVCSLIDLIRAKYIETKAIQRVKNVMELIKNRYVKD